MSTNNLLPGKATSLWMDGTQATDFPALTDGLKVDVAVVGAGIAGLTTAMLLQEEGLKVAVIESDRIASGVTAFTTAKITSAHELIYDHLVGQFGQEKARNYGAANQWAIEEIDRLQSEYRIECQYRRDTAYTYATDKKGKEQIKKEAEAATKLDLPVSLTTSTDLPFPVKCAIKYDNQAQFNPRLFLLGLAKAFVEKGGLIFENTRAVDIEEGEPCVLVTENGKLEATDIVMATHFPFYDKGFYFARLSQYRSYALGLRLDGYYVRGMYISTGDSTLSIRTHRGGEEDVLIFGGMGHKTGQGGDTRECYRKLEEEARKRFKVKDVLYHWSAQDNVTPDKVPYIGLHIPTSKHVYVSTGFGKWGMTNGVAGARLITDLILGRDNLWTDLYSPNRVKLTATGPLIKEGLNTAKEFVVGKLTGETDVESLKPGEGTIIRRGVQQLAVHKRDDGSLSVLSGVCTHMGCTVDWNPAEQSWDCPCHGSRFDAEGKVLHGPALKELAKETLK